MPSSAAARAFMDTYEVERCRRGRAGGLRRLHHQCYDRWVLPDRAECVTVLPLPVIHNLLRSALKWMLKETKPD
jgi:hypothetical protein